MLALLYDVHGNLPALEAVIEDAEGVGADRFLLGGDYAFAGAWPLETVERLRTLDGDWIRGNGERWTAVAVDAPGGGGPAVAAVARRSSGRRRRRAARRPAGDDLARRRALLPRLADLRRARASCPWPARRRGASRRPQPGPGGVRPHPPGVPAQRPGGVQLLNPGSVGMPCDGDHRAAYALLHGHGRRSTGGSSTTIRPAPMPSASCYGDAGEVPARRIEQARFDVS